MSGAPARPRARGLALGVTFVWVVPVWAGPSMGCCCVAKADSYTCSEKTQADCLALQPAAPTFPRIEDWKKAWAEAVAASKAQEAKPMRGGWIAGPCEK